MTCQHCGASLAHKRRASKFCGPVCCAAWHRATKANTLEAALLAARGAIDDALAQLRKTRQRAA